MQLETAIVWKPEVDKREFKTAKKLLFINRRLGNPGFSVLLLFVKLQELTHAYSIEIVNKLKVDKNHWSIRILLN